MLKMVLLSTVAVVLVATRADARVQFTLGNHSRFVSTLPHQGQSVPASPRAGRFAYTMLSNYACSCCEGDTISGPSSLFGVAYGVAEQFKLKKAEAVTKLLAGVAYVSGDHSVTLSLYADNGSNEPGTLLAQGMGTVKVEFGLGCAFTKVRIEKTRLSAHTPYWIAITTTGSNFESTPFKVSHKEPAVYVSYSSNGGNTWNSGTLEKEFYPAIGVK